MTQMEAQEMKAQEMVEALRNACLQRDETIRQVWNVLYTQPYRTVGTENSIATEVTLMIQEAFDAGQKASK